MKINKAKKAAKAGKFGAWWQGAGAGAGAGCLAGARTLKLKIAESNRIDRPDLDVPDRLATD